MNTSVEPNGGLFFDCGGIGLYSPITNHGSGKSFFVTGVIQFRILSQHIDISPLVKSVFNHLEQGSEHKNCITAHVFFFCVCMETAELTISLSLSPPSPSLCFDPG